MKKSRFSTFSLFLHGICLVTALTFLGAVDRAETEKPLHPESNSRAENTVRADWPFWVGAIGVAGFIGSIILLSKRKTTSNNDDLPDEEDTYFG